MAALQCFLLTAEACMLDISAGQQLHSGAGDAGCTVRGGQRQQPAVPFRMCKRVLVGSRTPTDGVLASVRQMLPAASIKLSYAMTEVASSMTFCTLTTGVLSAVAASSSHLPAAAGPLPAAAAVCVGRPAPGVELDVQPTAGLPPGAFLLHLHDRQHS